jgi:hypothetical protein
MHTTAMIDHGEGKTKHGKRESSSNMTTNRTEHIHGKNAPPLTLVCKKLENKLNNSIPAAFTFVSFLA